MSTFLMELSVFAQDPDLTDAADPPNQYAANQSDLAFTRSMAGMAGYAASVTWSTERGGWLP